MSESGRGEERRERERGEKEERGEESDGESLYKGHKHNRQKGQRIGAYIIIIKLSATWC